MVTLIAPPRPELGKTSAEIGLYLGSVVEYSATGEPAMETFYYHKDGQAFGYAHTVTGAVLTYGSCIQWAAAKEEPLTDWLKLEQVAAGLRRAVAVQRKPVGIPLPAPLLRLRAAACLAITKANSASAAPLRGWSQLTLLDLDDVQAA